MEAKTHIIKTVEELNRLYKYASDVPSPYIFVDCETNSKFERTAQLWGFSICFNDQRAFYIPWRDQQGNKWWTKDIEQQISVWLFNTCKVKKLINHNILYDVLVLENNLNINLTPLIYSDTILLKHTIDEEPPFGLKELAVIELGPGADKAQQALKDNVVLNGGSWKKEQKDMYKADTDILAEYAMWDVLLTFKLFKIYSQRLKEQGLEKFFYEEEVMPLYKEVTIPMKRSGFPIDVQYFKNLKSELETLISDAEHKIFKKIESDVQPFITALLNKEVPVKPTGNFPKAVAEFIGAPLPLRRKVDKNTKQESYVTTLNKKDVEQQKKQNPEYSDLYDWILGLTEKLNIEPMAIDMAQRHLFLNNEKNKNNRYIFNLSSNDHLAYYFFQVKNYQPLAKTHKGKDKLDANFLETIKEKYADEIADKLLEMKKLGKLLSTYVDGILDRQHDGIIYTSFLQFGTTSGRYSSRDPNCQNLPRVKDEEDSDLSPLVLKYVNAIKAGFVAGKGFKLVNADYSQLEPSCFAEMSGSESLRDVFRKGKDLYSQVAIDVNKLQDQYSAVKSASNFLKKLRPELRQLWKVPPLGIVYGMEESRLMQSIPGIDYKEAKRIINGYLGTYPELKSYMYSCNASAKKYGYVKTMFGRIRHLPQAKELFDKYGNDLLDFKWARAKNLLDERRLFKKCLNNAKNFPIQGLAAHIVNRAAIQVNRRFKEAGIEGCIIANVHDELTCRVREDQAEEAAKILQECMENTTKLNVPLVASPLIGDNWAEAK